MHFPTLIKTVKAAQYCDKELKGFRSSQKNHKQNKCFCIHQGCFSYKRDTIRKENACDFRGKLLLSLSLNIRDSNERRYSDSNISDNIFQPIFRNGSQTMIFLPLPRFKYLNPNINLFSDSYRFRYFRDQYSICHLVNSHYVIVWSSITNTIM